MMKIALFALLALKTFLLMEPIQTAFETGDFSNFRQVCSDRISVNFEEPFLLNGYFSRDKFIYEFSGQFSEYEIGKIEWSSMQIQDPFAVQSLNLVLKHRRSGRIIYYKFIFFMTRDQEWKLYYLKGLKL
jgi:hypothetical protein